MAKRRNAKAAAVSPPDDPMLDIALDRLIDTYQDPTTPQSARIAAAVAALPFFYDKLDDDDGDADA